MACRVVGLRLAAPKSTSMPQFARTIVIRVGPAQHAAAASSSHGTKRNPNETETDDDGRLDSWAGCLRPSSTLLCSVHPTGGVAGVALHAAILPARLDYRRSSGEGTPVFLVGCSDSEVGFLSMSCCKPAMEKKYSGPWTRKPGTGRDRRRMTE